MVIRVIMALTTEFLQVVVLLEVLAFTVCITLDMLHSPV
jgi:hypothetical protein